jgi:cell wall-associated NlpC family hydrolase
MRARRSSVLKGLSSRVKRRYAPRVFEGMMRRLAFVGLGVGLLIVVVAPAITLVTAPRASAASSGQAIVNAAEAWLTNPVTPYCWDGGNDNGPTHGDGDPTSEYSGPAGDSGCSNASTVGFDCSGLVKYALYQALGVSLGHTVEDEAAGTTDSAGSQVTRTLITSEADLQPGDIVAFGYSATDLPHDGIYVGNGDFVNAYDFENDGDNGTNNEYWGVTTTPLAWETGGTAGIPFFEGIRYASTGSGSPTPSPADTSTDLAINGGFNAAVPSWQVEAGSNFATYTAGQIAGTNPYSGTSYAATNTPNEGGGIFEDISQTIVAGDTYCASAEVVTDGNFTGGGGAFVLWLLGDSANESSQDDFSNLPGGNNWTPVSTCVTATASHNDVRVQFYPNVDGPTIGMDDVDTQAKGFGVNFAEIPGTLAATPGSGAIALSWTAPSLSGVSGVTGYDIYEGTSSGGESGTPVNASPVTTPTYTVSDLSNGSAYFFTVEALNSGGPLSVTNEASATPTKPPTPTTTPPSKPTTTTTMPSKSTTTTTTPSKSTTTTTTPGKPSSKSTTTTTIPGKSTTTSTTGKSAAPGTTSVAITGDSDSRPSIVLSTSTIVFSKRGLGAVKVSCELKSCSGSLQLRESIVTKEKTGKKTISKTTIVVLATGSYRLNEGSSGLFDLALTASGKRVVMNLGRSKTSVRASLIATVESGITSTKGVGIS